MTPQELAELRHERAAAYHEMQRAVGDADDSRSLSGDELRAYDAAERRFDALTDRIELGLAEADAARANPAGPLLRGDGSGDVFRAAARNSGPYLGERRFADAFGIQSRSDETFSTGALLQALAGTRTLPDDSPEMRTIVGSTGSAGTLVPEAVAAAILDGVLPASVVHQAGAVAVPMPARSLTLPRIDAPPVPGWHAEGQADVPVSEPEIGAAELVAKAVAVRFSVAIELLEDASQEAADGLRTIMVAAIADAIDGAALTGSGTNNAPLGLFNDTDVAHTTLGTADGGPLTNYSDLLAAVFAVRGRNLAPNAAIYSERTALEYAGLVDTTGQPLNAPKPVADLEQYSTTAVPNNLTEGASTDASFVAVGKFDQLAIGYRPQVGVRVEASSIVGESLTREFVAWCRADVAVLRPAAFQIVDGVTPA